MDLPPYGPLAIDSTPPQGATLNQPYAVAFYADGTPPVSLSATGALPPGLQPVTSAGVLAGTPTAVGAYPIMVSATDGSGASVSQPFTVQVFQHGFRLSGSMVQPRGFHTATVLASGAVLIAGGYGSGLTVAQATALAETFDPATLNFTATGSMQVARSGHTATLLCNAPIISCSNPKVLVVGGENADPNALATAELFDPVTGAFSLTGSLLAPRTRHTATLLGNGKVLIVGGSEQAQYDPSVLADNGELYDPATGAFTATGNLNAPRDSHTATLLANGKVLIAGGYAGGVNTVAAAELYDPATGMFAVTGSMAIPRANHTAILLSSGKVLIAGGGQARAEIYDPATGLFTLAGSLSMPSFSPSGMVLLSDGTVLVTDGVYAELFDPSTGTFSETGGMGTPVASSPGTVVVTGLGAATATPVLVTGDLGAAVYQ